MRKLLLTCALGISTLMFFTGCDQLKNVTDATNDNTAPEAYITAPQSVGIGETANLDGSNSSDPDGDAITYNWTFVEKPTNSQTTILNATDAQASFVPDARGTYKIQLTVSDGNDDGVASASVSANVPEIQSINQNTILDDIFDDPSEPDYRVTGTVNINAQLTIQPGVHIMFESGTSMDIESEGSLIAIGSATDSIRFSGEQATPGFWDGLYVNSNNPNNEISYCVVEYGGGYYGNIYITNDSQIKINHSASRYSGGTGLFAADNAKLPGFESNLFAQNAGAAIHVPARLVGSLDAGSVYSAGNTNNYIEVAAVSVQTDQTWPATDAPYMFKANDTNVSSVITIQAGATLMFASGAGLDIESGGQLIAVGTPTDSITFTGAQRTPGYWQAIYINSNNPGNELTYCNIEYAGGYYGNIYVTNTGQLKMTHSTSQYSSGDGLVANTNSKLPTFSTNAFLGNEGAAILIPAQLIGSIDGASTYLGGNAHDYIDVDATAVITQQTWPATDAPYRFQANDTNVGAQVTIEPGATLLFDSDAGLDIESGGALIAVGTVTDSITFTGEIPTAGYWQAVYINSNNPLNELSYCNIGFAGQYYADVYIASDSQLKLNHSTIHNSSGYGLYLASSSSAVDPADPVNDGNNVFYNNASGDIRTP